MVSDSLYRPGESGNYKGRPAGIPDWRSRYYDTRATLARMKHDPVEEIVKLAKDETAGKKLQFLANKELMARIAPPIKAITINTDINDKEAIEILKDELRQSLDASVDKFKKEY